MSEYQYYEFLAVDRPLEDRQIDDLRRLSTRAHITPTSFVNTYEWGDFRGNPCALMEKYFDAFLYLANWGTHRLMLRLPPRLLDLKTAQQYCVGEAASVWAEGDQVILDLVSEDEQGDWEDSGEGWLASIIPLRAELGSGDLRALYFSWLLSAQAGELEDEAVEPRVPPGLATLTAPLRSLADFLRIDEDLLAIAAVTSEQSGVEHNSEADLAQWIESLPVVDKDELILRIALGDDVHLQVELLRRFRGQHPETSEADTPNRTVGEMLDAAQARRQERERLAKERREQERARRERKRVVAREKHLESLALREEQAWQRVSMLIDAKKPGEYDAAVELLKDLQSVAEGQSRLEAFEQRFQRLHQQHLRKSSLLERLARAGLGAAPGRHPHAST